METDLELRIKNLMISLESALLKSELKTEPIFRNGRKSPIPNPAHLLPKSTVSLELSNKDYSGIRKIEREDETTEKGYMETVSFSQLSYSSI